MKELGANKKNLRFLGKSLDSHVIPRVRRIKRDTILETLPQEANDEFWKLNEKNIQNRRVVYGGYDLCFEIYPEDFILIKLFVMTKNGMISGLSRLDILFQLR